MKVSILGAAGAVGSAAAFHIATLALAEEIVLLDLRSNLAEQHAIDLGTAVSPLKVGVKAGTYDDIAGSHVVINAAGVHEDEDDDLPAERSEMLRKNTLLVRDVARQIQQHCPQAVVITATNPVDLLNYATQQAGTLDRRQVIGYSLNDSLRFREYVAQAKGVSVDRVEAMVIGEHGPSQVLLFSSVLMDGRPVSFTEDEKRWVRNEVPKVFHRFETLKAGRTAGWTCAVGLAAVTRAVLHDTGGVFPGSTVLEGEYGLRGLSMGVPLRWGRTGMQEIIERELAPDERAALERSAERVMTGVQVVDKLLRL